MNYLQTARKALAAIRYCEERPPQPELPATGDADANDFAYVADMPLRDFAQARLIVRVYSELLDREVLFVSDNVSEGALKDSDLPVYRATELMRLAAIHPEPRMLRCVHEVKTVFKGVISSAR